MKRLFLALVVVLVASVAVQAADMGGITVVVKGLATNDGRVSAALFKSAKGWPDDASKAVKVAIAPIKGKKATFVFDQVPYGQYAFAIIHDENRNGKMDYNIVGIPKEGYAFSNNAKGTFGPAKFKDAKFKLDKPKVSQTINTLY